MRKAKDPRVNAGYPVWLEFIILWFSMLCLTGGQAMIFHTYGGFPKAVSPMFIVINVGYWGIMSASFLILVVYLRRVTWNKPMRKLSEAARQVAAGDFSVHLEPNRADGKKDFVEVMYEDFNTMVVELASTETMKSDFISNVSHEIKTPLAIIENYASSLSAENIFEYKDAIVTASHKLNTLVQNILRLTKLENSEINPKFTEFDVCRQLLECVLSFESQWAQKNITFEADIDDKAIIRSDFELLEIVWNNLLSNSLKFTEHGGSIKLTQTSETDTVTVELSDTGCGMDAQTLKHVFDKFYQGDTSRSSEGNGLGLALVWRIVQGLDGEVSVRSKPEEGTTFTVTLKTGL